MMCSARELQLGEDHDGIIELPADAPVGASFADYAGLDDAVFDVAITPNRQDCMGVRGIARDLAAAGLGTLKPLDVPVIDGSFDNPDRDPHRGPRRLPGLLRARPSAASRNGASPGLDAAAAEGGGPASDLGAGRHHQLCDARPRPSGRTPMTSPSWRAR